MVGLSIVLEAQKGVNKQNPQVINKVTLIKPSRPPPSPSPSPSPSLTTHSWRWNSPSTTFLDQCFLCKQTLLPGKDIFMYKGDRAFCSVDCRCKHIFMDEEETVRRENCSFASMKPTSSSSSSSASSHRHHHRKGIRNRANGFAY